MMLDRKSLLEDLETHADETSLYYLGQAGFIFRSRVGTKIGVDLYLTDCVERFDGFKRLSPKVINPDDIILDYIVATHWHLDHFDIDAIPELMVNGKTRLLCAEDCKKHVADLRIDDQRVTFVKAGDTIQCDDVTIHAVFCDHGESTPMAIGLVLEIDNNTIYIAGDTSLRLDRAQDIAAYGPFDVMIAPINGAFGNMNEQDNVELCKYHRPYLNIPCHYWTFAEQHGDPGTWMEYMRNEMPDQKYALMAPGEKFVLKNT